MRAVIAALFAAILLPVAAVAKPPSEVEDAALRIGSVEEPPPGFKPVGRGMVKPIRLTGVMAPDWLIDSEKSGMPSYNCGTGGCYVEIWSQQPDGHYARIYANQMRARDLHRISGDERRWLEVDFHGTTCNLAGAEACPWGFEWQDDGFGGKFLGSSLRFIDGEIVRAGGFPQALDPLTQGDRAQMPAELLAVVDKDQAACAASGGKLGLEGLAGRLPDLNGDGVPDWAYDGLLTLCDYGEGEWPAGDRCAQLTCGTRLWVSRREGGTVAWAEVAKTPERPYALRLTKAGVTGVYQLDAPPGVSDDSLEACDTGTLARCVLTPLSVR